MPATLTVRELLYSVSGQLLDANPQFIRWAEAELVRWLNEAQVVIAKYLPHACARVDAIRLAPGTKQSIESIPAASVVPGDGSTASQVYGNALLHIGRSMGDNGLKPGPVVRIVDRDVLDASNPNWHYATARVPVREYTFDPRTPKIFYVSPPVPTTTAHWIEASYLANPPAVAVPGAGASLYAWSGGNTTRIGIDDKYADDIFNYVMARALMKDAESQSAAGLSNSYVSLFTASINAQATAMLGVNPNLQSLPLTPGIPAAAR